MVTMYLVSLLAPLAALWFGYPAAMEWLIGHWNSEEYSHAFLIPVVGVYMVLLSRSSQERIDRQSPYWGIALLSSSALMLLLAHYGQMISLYGFSLLAMAYGLFLMLAGWEAAKRNWSALLLLAFVVPLPTALFNGMSNSLQLVSSRLGAAMIELAGITVHLEGNVIDIGTMQLQVVEACSGLRYLLPLTALAYIVAVFRGSSLMRGLALLIAAAPITIVMNSFRIALTAVLSEYVGVNTAEGFLHDFEGWVIFFPALGLLLLLNWAMSKIAGTKDGESDWNIVPQDGFGNLPAAEMQSLAAAGRPALASAIVVMIAVACMPGVLPQKKIVTPSREQFAVFPLELHEWKGQHQRMDVVYRNALPWSDYLLANYAKPGGGLVNVFVPYFPSLYEDSYSHNPAVCLPGNGWVIEEQGVKDLPVQRAQGGNGIRINRLVATIDGKKHVVYYWFQHKGRIIASQNMVKPVLLWNSLTEGRTDGALVRLTIGMDSVSDMPAADAALEEVATQMLQVLPRFVPS
jgi:exosortase D (VPLPA-CTERM-specific)